VGSGNKATLFEGHHVKERKSRKGQREGEEREINALNWIGGNRKGSGQRLSQESLFQRWFLSQLRKERPEEP